MKQRRITGLLLAALLSAQALTFSAGALSAPEDTAAEESRTEEKMPEHKPRRSGKPPANACLTAGLGWYCPPSHAGVRTLDQQMAFVEQYPVSWHDSSADENNRVLYLTFDAGYENGNVAKILDILKEKQVSGAFFVLEHLIEANPELIIRMAEEGHLVCNHTSSHRDMSKVTRQEEFAAELVKLEETCRNTTGVEMAKFYRPPEGKFSETNLVHAAELGYHTVFWSMAYADWDNARQPDPAEAREKVLSRTVNGDILLLHPTSAVNAEILGGLIDTWREQGYRFGRLNDLITGGEQT